MTYEEFEKLRMSDPKTLTRQDIAHMYDRCKKYKDDFGMTNSFIANRLNITRQWVSVCFSHKVYFNENLFLLFSEMPFFGDKRYDT